MNFPEIKKFLEWYYLEKKRGLQLPIHYNYGFHGFSITESLICDIQLIAIGVKIISPAKACALEAFFLDFNSVNKAAKTGKIIPRPDVL